MIHQFHKDLNGMSVSFIALIKMNLHSVNGKKLIKMIVKPWFKHVHKIVKENINNLKYFRRTVACPDVIQNYIVQSYLISYFFCGMLPSVSHNFLVSIDILGAAVLK